MILRTLSTVRGCTPWDDYEEWCLLGCYATCNLKPVAACVVPSSPILVTLMKEAPGSSETSVLTRTTRR
jgi:hypothetical protein